MAFRHGSKASITINSVDLSAYSDNLSLDITPETADTTGFGSTWRTHLPGLIASLMAAAGPEVAVVDKPGGSGTGQRNNAFNAIVSGYNETSTVDDKVTWSAELTVTGAVTMTTL